MDAWIDAAAEAAREFAETALGCPMEAGVPDGSSNYDLTCCLVALVGDEASLQVGFASDAEGCQSLARALLGADEPLPESDVVDAMGEIANIIGGGVKKRMRQDGGIHLGLPMVLHGRLKLTESHQVAHLAIKVGVTDARLFVIRGAPPPAGADRSHRNSRR